MTALSVRPLRAATVQLTEACSVVVYVAEDAAAALDRAIAEHKPAPYGAVLWDSAIIVARVLLKRPDPRAMREPTGSSDDSGTPLAGLTVVELGAGCGLCGVVAALRGARVVCTDVDELVFAAVRAAADAAGVGDRVDCAVFDVCGPEPLPAVDVVIIADLLYEAELAGAVARRVLEAHTRGMAVVVGDPERAGRASFVRLLKEGGVDARFDDNVMVLGWP